MKITNYRQFELNFDCDEARELLFLYILDNLALSLDERRAIEEHLKDCKDCLNEYEQLKYIDFALTTNKNEFIHKNASQNRTSEAKFDQLSDDEADFLKFQAKMYRAIARRKKNEKRNNWAQLRSALRYAFTIAACLTICFGLFFAANQFNKAHNDSSSVASGQLQNPLKIELISGSTAEIIPAGQLIVSAKELKTLRINDNRQMVLNIGTELTVETCGLGCVVKLNNGEVYAEVQHDGKPFIVETRHGRAIITGTTFNIKVDNEKMDLAVVDGSVQFESDKGGVCVNGGYQSLIAAGMQPAQPAICDVGQVTLWANRQAGKFSQPDTFKKDVDISITGLPLTSTPYCNLEDIDFDIWISEHREWFEREFPWAKRLQKLLAQDGVEVDTIDLLIESGDLWRFAWPEYSQQRILTDDRKVIQEIANRYGVEVDELASIGMVQYKQTPNIGAFEKWLNTFDKEQSNLNLDSIHAATFLVNTRSLAWHAINKNNIQVQEKQQIMDLLEEQVKTAINMFDLLNQMLVTNKNESVCSVIQNDEYIKKLKGGISLMIQIEDEIIGRKEEVY